MQDHYIVKANGRKVLATLDADNAYRRAEVEEQRHGARNVRVLRVGAQR
jgi:hypothetical protein